MLPRLIGRGIPPQKGFSHVLATDVARWHDSSSADGKVFFPPAYSNPVRDLCRTRVLSPRRGHYFLVPEEMGCHSRFNSRCSRALPQYRVQGLNLIRGHRSRVSARRPGRSVRGRITAARIGEGICDANTGSRDVLRVGERFVNASRHADIIENRGLRAPPWPKDRDIRAGRRNL